MIGKPMPDGRRALIALGGMTIASLMGWFSTFPSLMVLVVISVFAIELMLSGSAFLLDKHAARSKRLANAERRPTHIAEAVVAAQGVEWHEDGYTGHVTVPGGLASLTSLTEDQKAKLTKNKRVAEIDDEIAEYEAMALDHTAWGLTHSPWALAALVTALRDERDILEPPPPPEPQKRSQRSRWEVPLLDGGYQRTIEAREADIIAAMQVPGAVFATPLGDWGQIGQDGIGNGEGIPSERPLFDLDEIDRKGELLNDWDNERRRADQLEDDLAEVQARSTMLARQVDALVNENKGLKKTVHDAARDGSYSAAAYRALLTERDELMRRLGNKLHPCYYCRGRGCTRCETFEQFNTYYNSGLGHEPGSARWSGAY